MSAARSVEQTIADNAAHRIVAIDRAKICWEVYTHRAAPIGSQAAFEFLSSQEFEAWQEVYLTAESLIEDDYIDEHDSLMFQGILDELCQACEPLYIKRVCFQHGYYEWEMPEGPPQPEPPPYDPAAPDESGVWA